ncbi:hypothetical protein WUBG_06183 [Wuchereria bancrofti]|uniref:Uncharacterized protein n=1 Tax=Wuchereria bancrofti TaxID=6293 RepID=J9F0D3_WUCBA|nr:hypothetical protein WUBG_06183 [Wuchereria bancrofti]
MTSNTIVYIARKFVGGYVYTRNVTHRFTLPPLLIIKATVVGATRRDFWLQQGLHCALSDKIHERFCKTNFVRLTIRPSNSNGSHSKRERNIRSMPEIVASPLSCYTKDVVSAFARLVPTNIFTSISSMQARAIYNLKVLMR